MYRQRILAHCLTISHGAFAFYGIQVAVNNSLGLILRFHHAQLSQQRMSLSFSGMYPS